jgi:hypothetical protein
MVSSEAKKKLMVVQNSTRQQMSTHTYCGKDFCIPIQIEQSQIQLNNPNRK